MNKKFFIAIILISFIMLASSVFGVSADSGNGYIVKFKEGYVPPENNFAELSKSCNLYLTYNSTFSNDIKDNIEHIEQNIKIENTDYDYSKKVSLFSAPQDDYYFEQWQLKMINADSSWNIETYGNDVRIAVIDSGCSPHDDLNGNVLTGKNYFDNSEDVTDDIGHGTHVSGIIAAKMNNIGIVGTAPKAKIIPLKCFRKADDQTIQMLIKAIDEAVNVYHCKIINMSWGTTSNISALKDVINDAYEKGTILVASVGNKGNSTLYYPAAYDNVIGVGSVTQYKTKSYFSQYNSSVFVVASGDDVKSTFNNGNYYSLSGTSQAAPFVSGLAAIAVSADEALNPDEFKQLLKNTSEDLGTSGYDTKFGYGLINTELVINELLKKRPCYVSPINIDGSNAYVYIKNNSADILNAVCIFAKYNNSLYSEMSTENLLLPVYSDILVKAPYYDSSTSCMLWNSLSGIVPLSPKRTYNTMSHSRKKGVKCQ